MATNTGHVQQVATRAVSDQARASLKRLAFIVIVGLFVVSFFVASVSSVLAASGTWTITGNMTAYRFGHTATLLQNGQVLVVGGSFDSQAGTAELYNPTTGAWSSAGKMNFTHTYAVAALLQNGQVLVAGDFSFFSDNGNYADLYNPTTGKWSVTGSMNTGRVSAQAVLLSSGKVLVAGGYLGPGFNTPQPPVPSCMTPPRAPGRSPAA